MEPSLPTIAAEYLKRIVQHWLLMLVSLLAMVASYTKEEFGFGIDSVYALAVIGVSVIIASFLEYAELYRRIQLEHADVEVFFIDDGQEVIQQFVDLPPSPEAPDFDALVDEARERLSTGASSLLRVSTSRIEAYLEKYRSYLIRRSLYQSARSRLVYVRFGVRNNPGHARATGIRIEFELPKGISTPDEQLLDIYVDGSPSPPEPPQPTPSLMPPGPLMNVPTIDNAILRGIASRYDSGPIFRYSDDRFRYEPDDLAPGVHHLDMDPVPLWFWGLSTNGEYVVNLTIHANELAHPKHEKLILSVTFSEDSGDS